MKEIEIKVSRAIKYITDYELFKMGFPTNKIYIKTLPGWGATHGEIKIFRHHSICVNPHVPVIEEKSKAKADDMLKYPDICVVYEKVTQSDVLRYLKGNVVWKKILCTPEAYDKKVRPAIEESEFDLFKDFYMLLDECDKLIKDVGFRPMVEAPMDDFFMFENKSMISATALVPTDPRFEQHGFEIYRIVPDYDYSQPLDLVITNNIIASLEKVINAHPNEKFFIFINSATHIHAIIEALGIAEQSIVYCSGKSVRKLAKEGFDNANDKLSNYPRFTFFTSRYFSAVDVFLETKPIVIMITDVYDEKTLLDPYTDNVQIVGRARNGVSDIYHITGTNPSLETIDENEVRQYLDESYSAFQEVKQLGNNIKSSGGKDTLSQCLSAPKILNIIKKDESLHHGMIDNFMLDNKIKTTYKSQDTLISTYDRIGNFKVRLRVDSYEATHKQMLTDYKNENFKIRCENVAKMMDVWRRPFDSDGQIRFVLGDFISTLERDNPDIADYFNKLTFEVMQKLSFDKRKMNRELAKIVKKSKFQDGLVRREVHAEFTLLIPVKDDIIKKKLTSIYVKNGYADGAKAADFGKFFESKRSTKDKQHITTPISVKPFQL
ncbi:hypothetical protein OQZ33_00480 [Pedobacter sp. MC2016-05]|uniref:hypothetical protein n=1 Tax=Pedobacter sp. MC2016-05 TaxID=2994474 RepID=UPI002248471C|nr:hypothetical protein [Pedobacter sp. MC2016-05]MCX2472794.1 hypothetical protein [Pedobacter sp. MC2016-05]